MIEPGKIAAGDSLSWQRTLPDYPASAGYTLHYAFINSGNAYTLDSVASGDNHDIDIAGTVTAAWIPGRYDWTAYVTGPSNFRKSLFVGSIIIEPDLTAGTGYDARSFARRMLDAIEAAMQNRATADQLDMLRGQFRDRLIERDPGRMVELRDKYLAEVQAEEQAAAIARGEREPRSVKLRFSRQGYQGSTPWNPRTRG